MLKSSLCDYSDAYILAIIGAGADDVAKYSNGWCKRFRCYDPDV